MPDIGMARWKLMDPVGATRRPCSFVQAIGVGMDGSLEYADFPGEIQVPVAFDTPPGDSYLCSYFLRTHHAF